MQAAMIGAAAAVLLATPGAAATAEASVMPLAAKAVGSRCRFQADRIGPQIAGFSNVKDVGQALLADGFVFVRRHGDQRVAFLARDGDKGCRILAAHPLPPAARSERFLQCEIADPDPFKNTPLSSGLGLRQNGRKPLVAYLEADTAKGSLTPHDGADGRIRCSDFESGD